MSVLPIKTYLSVSHGCNFDGKKELVQLEKNVVVIMNCNPIEMWRAEHVEAEMWNFATQYKDVKLDDVKTLSTLLENISRSFNITYINQQGVQKTNQYCVYLDKVPNVFLVYSDATSLMGAYELPVQATMTKTPVEFTSDDFKDYIHAYKTRDNNMRDERIIKQRSLLMKNPKLINNPTPEFQSDQTYMVEKFNETMLLLNQGTVLKVHKLIRPPELPDLPNFDLNSIHRGAIRCKGTHCLEDKKTKKLTLKDLIFNVTTKYNKDTQQDIPIPGLHIVIVHACTNGYDNINVENKFFLPPVVTNTNTNTKINKFDDLAKAITERLRLSDTETATGGRKKKVPTQNKTKISRKKPTKKSTEKTMV
jgi:hypothetical protein